MIRPSSLQLAEKCDLAPWLAREYPGTTEAAERGSEVDRLVAEFWQPGGENSGGWAGDPDAKACVYWIDDNAPSKGPLHIQEFVELHDPDTGELITAGTPDYAWANPDGSVTILDLKKREQWYAAKLAPPDENLQLHAYGIAHALRSGAPEYRLCALLFGDGEVEPLWSRTYTAAEWRPILERIKRISSRVMNSSGTRPKGFSGPHCTGCYQRYHCPHWLLPAMDGGAALTQITGQGGITTDNAARAVLLRMQLAEAERLLDGMLKSYVDVHGPIQIGEDKQWGPAQSKGRKTADVQALEKAGLHQFVKEGRPYVSYRLTRRGGSG